MAFIRKQANENQIPYRRGDRFVEAFVGTKTKKPKRLDACRIGCIYPLNIAVPAPHIPEILELTEDFGFFVGAYLASGGCTTHHVMISNVNDEFNDKIDRFLNSIDVKYHIQDSITTYFDRRSKTLRMHSLVLTTLLCVAFGKSEEKRIPADLLGAPTVFLKGIIDGFMCGKGIVEKKLRFLGSVSSFRGLFEDLRQILMRFEIKSTIAFSEGLYHLMIHPCQITHFQTIFHFTITKKDDKLHAIKAASFYDRIDNIPSIDLPDNKLTDVPRKYVASLIEKYHQDSETLKMLENIIDEHIMYDPIINIERIPNENPWMYDFTVDGPRNFNIYSGLAMRDSNYLIQIFLHLI